METNALRIAIDLGTNKPGRKAKNLIFLEHSTSAKARIMTDTKGEKHRVLELSFRNKETVYDFCFYGFDRYDALELATALVKCWPDILLDLIEEHCEQEGAE